MWFKTLHLFQFKNKIKYEPEAWSKQLADKCFHPCGNASPMSLGWVPPIDVTEESPLVHGANGMMMLCLQYEKKLLPNTVISEEVTEKIAQIEKTEARKVGRKERQNLKDDIYFSLLPRAFSKTDKVYAYVDTQEGWLIVNAASRGTAEDFVSFLNRSIDGLGLTNPEISTLAHTMTQWLKTNKLPKEMEIGESCLLEDVQFDGGKVRCQNEDLFADRIQAFLSGNYEVKQIACSWADQLSFVLKDDFSIRQVKFLESVQNTAKESEAETEAVQFNVDFVIMSGVLKQFFKELMPHLGIA